VPCAGFVAAPPARYNAGRRSTVTDTMEGAMTAAIAETEVNTRREAAARPLPPDGPAAAPAATPPRSDSTPAPAGRPFDRYGGPDSPLRPKRPAPGGQVPSPGPAAASAPPKQAGPAPSKKEKGDARRQAAGIALTVVPASMASALGMGGHFDASGCRAYLDRLLADAGSPTDPVEVMLLEQLALAHFRSAQLQGEAGAAKAPEAAYRRASAAEDRPSRRKKGGTGGAEQGGSAE
jgi:hypothetical protein